MPTDDANSELIPRAVAGDALAFQELLLLHFDPLAAMLRPRIPADLQATVSPEDVLQEAFAEAARRIATFDGRDGGALYRWLATIAEHRLVDMIRAQRTAKRGGGRSPAGAGAGGDSSMDELILLVAVQEFTPSRSVASHEAAEAIRAALERISPDYRQAIRLRYFEGLPVAEVAAQMQRSEGAVHALLSRGLTALRAELGRSSDFFSRKE